MKEHEWNDGILLRHIYNRCLNVELLMEEFGGVEALFYQKLSFRDSVSMNVMYIGEFAKRLSEEFRESTKNAIPWQAIISMRNRFAHNYDGMDQKMIWDTAVNHVPVLKRFCEQQIPMLTAPSVPTDEEVTL